MRYIALSLFILVSTCVVFGANSKSDIYINIRDTNTGNVIDGFNSGNNCISIFGSAVTPGGSACLMPPSS